VQSKFIAGALLVFLVTSMFSSQSAFAGIIGGACQSAQDCNDNNACTTDSCEGFIPPIILGTCFNFPNVGAPCGDAATQCTIQDTCNVIGVCEDNGVQPVGVSCEADQDECTGPDTCDGSGTCEAGPPITGTPACFPVSQIGGEIISIESSSLILAGANSFSWMIPVVLSVLGIGLVFLRRK